MLNDGAEGFRGAVAPGSAEPRGRPARAPTRETVKSATRALEIIELFGICRGALSVSDVAQALDIPQSSSSILLKAMNKAGFVDRDRSTRKYRPSLRSAFLGTRVHDVLFRRIGLLRRLDDLALETGLSVRLGIRNGIYVQYAHISWPDPASDRLRLRPGSVTPICHDAVGAMLLVAEENEAVRAVVRHVNAVTGAGLPAVRPEAFVMSIEQARRDGFLETAARGSVGERVLAVRLPTCLDVPAAIGLHGTAERLERDHAVLLARLWATADAAVTADRRAAI